MYGGSVFAKRNIDSLEAVYGEKNVVVYSLTQEMLSDGNIFKRIKLLLQGYIIHSAFQQKYHVMKIIENENINAIFFDFSLMGKLCKDIKRRYPRVEIIMYFQNIEIQYIFNQIKTTKKFHRFYWVILIYWNELLSCKYSDKIITLNSRDANLLRKLYGRKTDAIIPISISDVYNIRLPDSKPKNRPFTILFIGSFFYANVQGIIWFVKKIMPLFPNVELEIVGKDMHEIQEQARRPNVKIYSNVPSLQEYYSHADLVVLPIFTGGGMKVKTAEALMYGKTIIGTPEAFCGYDFHPEIGKMCIKKGEFYDAINYYLSRKTERFNIASRNLFLTKYSFDSTLKEFMHILS
jgi:glycosyltransferase involved in cell wall biosynthesis